ncbi:hypothetical protein [Corynebacterium sanguinis]|uniref:hypothetical protein n=1 Tax=Corynebacterium sanguinis TaxID=2594913 RepID=UPI0028834459|nr:hypothetical protein [Corynebacterium sanguinis]
MILFAGVFGVVWTKLGSRQPSYATKFSLALFIIGLATLVFLPFVGGGPNSTPFWAIVVILFLFTMAELMLSPVGNSMATLVAPQVFPTRAFALWLLSVALGTAMSGTLAGFYDPSSAASERTYFLTTAAVMLAVGAAIFASRRWITAKLG